MNSTKLSALFGPGRLWLLAALVAAIAVPASTAEDSATPEQPIVLSPFVVGSETDHGYTATNTEAGSRLNSKLADTPAPISVMTKEFLNDLAITNIQDAMEFGVNTESTRSQDDNQNLQPAYTIRGIRSTQVSRNFFISGGRLDTYIIDRTTFSRGPNSILFGNADPSGIVNVSTKQAMFKPLREISTRLDDNGSWRVSTDLNQIVVPDRVALRVDLLKEKYYGPMQPDYRNDNGYYLAATVKLVDRPNYKLSVRGDYEHDSMGRVLARVSNVLIDAVSPWLAAGQPAITTAGGAASNRPVGISSISGSNRLIAIEQGGPLTVMNWKNMGVGTSTNLPIMDESIWPIYINPQGLSGGRNGGTSVNGSAYIDQQFGKGLFLQLSYNRFSEHPGWWKGLGTSAPTLNVDPNKVLPNGQSNPNFGRYYYDGQVQFQIFRGESDAKRAALAYEHDFERENSGFVRALGFQRLAASFEDFTNYKFSQQYRETNTTPLPGYSADLSNSSNYIYRRWYLDRASGLLSAGDAQTPINQDGVTSALLPVVLPSAARADQESMFVADQAYWWKRRIITTVGMRHDEVKGYSNDPSFGAMPNGVFPTIGKGMISHTPSYENKTNTKSFGVVVHVNKWLSLFGNQSDNFLAGAVRNNIGGTPIELPSGKSRDFGIKFQTPNGRLSGSLSRYDSTKHGEYITASWTTDFNAIWDTLGEPQKSTKRPGGLMGDWSDTRDFKAQGYELELTYNVNSHWRLSANANEGNAVVNNALPGANGYIAQNIDLWRQNGTLTTPNGRTINQLLDNDILPWQRDQNAQNGTSALLRRKWGGNVVTAYRFNDGLLRGTSVGGSGQFRDRPIIGYPNSADGTPDTAHPWYGNRSMILGAFARYERKIFSGRIRWSAQLNVQNLLDDTELQKSAKNSAGQITKVTVIASRVFVLTNTFSF